MLSSEKNDIQNVMLLFNYSIYLQKIKCGNTEYLEFGVRTPKND